ncbi:right-handed parallel beta-helix repeat-containing protein [Flammeovirga aprica]|uniref:T9SS type A sorting domain-containing protein n=1 Tax=Flammeovirga aprica JL-4 TaxID=694437 RepID=A0A7X9S0W3_9BACT|nr:right-handed parallel beta-helix repeat-containing protein [Flammeovirga aprica]NME72363.1 T9SS type A sorting domain-containing protein [Flammeovirga aprica JL-4]
MKFIITTALLFCFIMAKGQTTYHVYSDEIPWETSNPVQENGKMYSINEAISKASDGDIIEVHEGIYREKLVVNKDNLTIKNYQNEYVLVTGAEVVNGWTKASGMAEGVYQASVSNLKFETEFTQLFDNGIEQVMGRHPNNTSGEMMDPMGENSGYALLSDVWKEEGENANGYATLEDENFPNVDLTGGIFRGLTGKMRNYVIGNITANEGNSVTFKAHNNGVWKDAGAIKNTQHKFSWGFVMHKNLVDSPGEWFKEGNTVFYFPQNGEAIHQTRIEVQVREKVLVLNNTSGSYLDGIHFVAGNAEMINTNQAKIENCSFRHLYPFWKSKGYGDNNTEKTGIYLSNSSDNTFKNTQVAHTWGNAIAVKGGNNNQFENCLIEDFGWLGIFTSGIYATGDYIRVQHCTFGDAARFHIRIRKNIKFDILDSDFFGAMRMGEDAGPIEATSTGTLYALNMKGSEIAYNKIHDVHGLPVSDGGYNKQKITAFYMEDTENYTAHHNLIYNIKADNYTGPHSITRHGEFLYLGPRYNPMDKPVNYYNNTIWNVDFGISIWNIEIDNWEELGINHSTGYMKDGHFANNIFMSGTGYKMSYVRQKLSATGGNLGWVAIENSPSIETEDFDAFTAHVAKYNYHFNPEHNQHYDFSEGGNHFTDADNGDFNLLNQSSAKGAGVAINGITNADNPDCGALEGSNRVMQAGANLQLADRLEQTNHNAQETVGIVSFKDEFTVATLSFPVEVHYNTHEERDVVIILKDPEGGFIQSKTVTVDKGVGTVSEQIEIDTALVINENYSVTIALRPVGASWTENIVTVQQNFNIIEMPESVSFIDPLSEYEATITVNVSYTAHEQRDLNLILQSETGEYISSEKVQVEKGSGIEEIILTAPNSLIDGHNYRLLAALREVGGNWSTNKATTTHNFILDSSGRIINSHESEKLTNIITIAPNPVIHTIKVSGVKSGTTYKLLDLRGRLLMEGVLTNGSIQLQKLIKGIYLLQFENSQHIKLIKN